MNCFFITSGSELLPVVIRMIFVPTESQKFCSFYTDNQQEFCRSLHLACLGFIMYTQLYQQILAKGTSSSKSTFVSLS